tara:strand:+ start:438 stop:671 length:234 start_codon:yes stop_codon:yes gene_type:complete
MLTKLHDGITNQLTNVLGFNLGIAALIVFILFMVIHLLITKWLWNNVLVQLVPSVKRATSMWQMLGLTILMSFVVPK